LDSLNRGHGDTSRSGFNHAYTLQFEKNRQCRNQGSEAHSAISNFATREVASLIAGCDAPPLIDLSSVQFRQDIIPTHHRKPRFHLPSHNRSRRRWGPFASLACLMALFQFTSADASRLEGLHEQGKRVFESRSPGESFCSRCRSALDAVQSLSLEDPNSVELGQSKMVKHHDSWDALQAAAETGCPICRTALKSAVARMEDDRHDIKHGFSLFRLKHPHESHHGTALELWINFFFSAEEAANGYPVLLPFLIHPTSGEQPSGDLAISSFRAAHSCDRNY